MIKSSLHVFFNFVVRNFIVGIIYVGIILCIRINSMFIMNFPFLKLLQTDNLNLCLTSQTLIHAQVFHLSLDIPLF